jgi:hypothetical protein
MDTRQKSNELPEKKLVHHARVWTGFIEQRFRACSRKGQNSPSLELLGG